jgi:hypothetical protein
MRACRAALGTAAFDAVPPGPSRRDPVLLAAISRRYSIVTTCEIRSVALSPEWTRSYHRGRLT